jgi:uncharacterized protein (DUF1697 family)
MKYIALLRGINVGGNHKVDMKKLKTLFESLGFVNVSTYINSGNVIFEGSGKTLEICQKLELSFKKEFIFDIPILVKTEKEIADITEAIPKTWKNDTMQRTDVAFLFPEFDSENIIGELPVKKEFIDIRYVKGAIYWNVKRENIYKSQLVKLIGHKLYKSMTVRNINTVRILGKENKL